MQFIRHLSFITKRHKSIIVTVIFIIILLYLIYTPPVSPTNCPLIGHDQSETCEALLTSNDPTIWKKYTWCDSTLSSNWALLIKSLNNCPRFRNYYNYDNYQLCEGEEEFPVAYSVLIYDKIESFERLLRAIYR